MVKYLPYLLLFIGIRSGFSVALFPESEALKGQLSEIEIQLKKEQVITSLLKDFELELAKFGDDTGISLERRGQVLLYGLYDRIEAMNGELNSLINSGWVGREQAIRFSSAKALPEEHKLALMVKVERQKTALQTSVKRLMKLKKSLLKSFPFLKDYTPKPEQSRQLYQAAFRSEDQRPIGNE